MDVPATGEARRANKKGGVPKVRSKPLMADGESAPAAAEVRTEAALGSRRRAGRCALRGSAHAAAASSFRAASRRPRARVGPPWRGAGWRRSLSSGLRHEAAHSALPARPLPPARAARGAAGPATRVRGRAAGSPAPPRLLCAQKVSTPPSPLTTWLQAPAPRGDDSGAEQRPRCDDGGEAPEAPAAAPEEASVPPTGVDAASTASQLADLTAQAAPPAPPSTPSPPKAKAAPDAAHAAPVSPAPTILRDALADSCLLDPSAAPPPQPADYPYMARHPMTTSMLRLRGSRHQLCINRQNRCRCRVAL
jgi:hypothetical protein